MTDYEGHLLPDPAEIYLPKDFTGIGMYPDIIRRMNQMSTAALRSRMQERLERYIADKQPEIFPEFDKMVAHLARVHNLHQDEITLLVASWFNSKKNIIKIDVSIL